MSAATSQPANSAETAGGWQDVSQPAETVLNSQGAAQADDAAQSGEPGAWSDSPDLQHRFASLAAQAQTLAEGAVVNNLVISRELSGEFDAVTKTSGCTKDVSGIVR